MLPRRDATRKADIKRRVAQYVERGFAFNLWICLPSSVNAITVSRVSKLNPHSLIT